ncbi:MAG: DUF4147 domain-containing protein [Rhizobacter sp.]|nr:DUF4147 domain-containing protein [Bacteriovorax sp.]
MELKNHAEEIFRAGLARVNSRVLLELVLTLENNVLIINTDTEKYSIDLSQYKKIKLIGFGKAAAQMAAGLCAVLENIISEGVLIVKDATKAVLPEGVEIYTGSHPVPGANSIKAGKRLIEFCSGCAEDELVIGVISGGASALVEVPAGNLTLEDIMDTTKILLASGATIQEMNCLRKHLSQIKGGQLSEKIFPATSLNFILSDVIGDDLSIIGSGPTVVDTSTCEDAFHVIKKYNLDEKLNRAIIETPKELKNSKNILVGTNRQALIAAGKKAQSLGYETIILSEEIQGEAREAAAIFFDLSKKSVTKPTCILGGGETTVTIHGNGIGGRNQEMALAYLCKLQNDTNQMFLSASTDGGDGPTDAAGAFASVDILKSASTKGLDPLEFLEKNDSYHFFSQAGGHLKTGSTETNVCDLQILLLLP